VTPLFVLLTNLVTFIPLPSWLCYDTAVMGASFDTGDSRPLYGIRLDVLDAKSRVVGGGWVQESYSPPATETVPVLLPPEAVLARCEIFGPAMDGKWKDAYFTVGMIQPELRITKSGAWIVIDWDAVSGRCWTLEANDGAGWRESPTVVQASKAAVSFRLVRPTNPP
jgi:hypothetical protein